MDISSQNGSVNLEDFKKTFIYKSIPNIIEITSPLKKIGINYFSYAEITADNKITALFNNEDNAKIGIQASIKNEPYLSPHRLITPGFYLPLRLNNLTEINKKHIRDCLEINGSSELCVFIKDDKQNTRRIYSFNFNYSPLIKYDFFEAFIHCFHDKVDYIIKKAERAILPSDIMVDYPLSTISQDHSILNEKLQSFLKDIDFYNYRLLRLARKYSLSKRQIQIIDLILQGKLTKQMAHNLNLSTRTIELYLCNLKTKLN